MRYRGREFTQAEIERINELMGAHPGASRRRLSVLVSEELDWRMPDGRLKDAAVRGVMLAMDRDGLIRLPPRVNAPWNPRKPPRETAAGEPGAPIEGGVRDLGRITLRAVADRRESALWNELIQRYHYLGYKRQGGAQMRYLARAADGRMLACLGYSVSAWKARPRDQWIGWSRQRRERHLHLVVNNSRFLILPWVRVPHLASKLLALAARQLPRDWRARYGYSPLLLETFVDRARFAGTCYRAANWLDVGETTGRGRYDTRHEAYGKSVKMIFLLPLAKHARERLAE